MKLRFLADGGSREHGRNRNRRGKKFAGEKREGEVEDEAEVFNRESW